MRIIAFINNNNGPSYHRITMPLMLMDGPDVYITNSLKVEDFEKGCDIFMYNRILPDHAIPQVKELQAKYGFKICVDVDDYWELDEHHILFEDYQNNNFAKRQIQQLKEADVVFTTHERLAMEVMQINQNVHVCPNAIPKQGQFDVQHERYYLTRLFWQGSDTHKADVALLKTPIERLNGISGKIKMVMAGYAPDHADWHDMAMNYTAGGRTQFLLMPYASIMDYYKAYLQADICLIPLVNSRFNRHKSNLKVLEAANMGLPVIASNVHPYLDMPLLYCKHSGDWIKHITRLVDSRKRQKEAGQQLAEFCQKHYNFHKINHERKQILEYVAKTEKV